MALRQLNSRDDTPGFAESRFYTRLNALINQGLDADNLTPVIFDVVAVDDEGWANGNSIIPNISGYFLLIFNVRIDGNAVGRNTEARLFQNDVKIAGHTYNDNGAIGSFIYHPGTIIWANAGDVFTAKIYNNSISFVLLITGSLHLWGLS